MAKPKEPRARVKLSIDLTGPEFDALYDLSQAERRRPSAQAAFIVAEHLALVATRAVWDAEMSERRAAAEAEAAQESAATEKGVQDG